MWWVHSSAIAALSWNRRWNKLQTRGAVIYLRQEGRGIGLVEKMKAYNLQAQGMDTYEANEALGHQSDDRRFDEAVAMLRSTVGQPSS